MKRTIIICIIISLLGGIYIYVRIAADYCGKAESLVPIVSNSQILKKSISMWPKDSAEKEANLFQKRFDMEESKLELLYEDLDQIKNAIDEYWRLSVTSDFLFMDSENMDFENKYDRERLYEEDILYCDINAWQYHGTQLDGFQNSEDYYDVTNITALRYIVDDGLYDFVEKSHAESYEDISFLRGVYIQYMVDYAISVYFQKDKDEKEGDEIKLLEISFVKVELEEGIAPESLYQYIEDDYYKVREIIRSADWIISLDGDKEVCVMNGALPKHPSQIFVRYREKVPDAIFRFTWEQSIAGWIGEEHIVCYRKDWMPYLIHLETDQIEDIESDVDDYDPYGAEYKINGDQLIVKVSGDEVYHWNIVKIEHEVYIIKENKDI